jgi:hypothetical protein
MKEMEQEERKYANHVRCSFDAGLYNMCPGEGRRLQIAPEFGYGVKGVLGVIPPNSTLSKSSLFVFYYYGFFASPFLLSIARFLE